MQQVPLDELPYFVGNVLAVLALQPEKPSATVIFLRGDLGAGKTTFVQEFAKKLGITDTIQSPTYVLMKAYPFLGERTSFGRPRRYDRMIHIDAYRLENPQEFSTIHPQDFLNDPKALVLVEWPERAEGLLPEPDITVSFSSEGAGEGERFVEMQEK